MKAIITGYFDHDGKLNLNERINRLIKHEIDHLALRGDLSRPLIELSEGELKKILLDTKAERIKLSVIDTHIDAYDPYDDRIHKERIDEFKHMLRVADKLKVNMLFLKLPIVHDIIEEYDTIEKKLGDYVDQAQRAGKKIVLLQQPGVKINTYVYIFKRMKSKYLSFAFDPVLIMNNNESTTTAYRLVRNQISVFFAHDANHLGRPELIGFGKTDILKLLKKLVRDRYDGYIMVDHSFDPSIFEFKDEPKGFFKKLFSKDKKKRETRLRELTRHIFPNEETKNVTEDDILSNQIKLLKTLLK